MKRLRLEPTLALYTLTAGWNAAQLVELPMRAWEHAIVLAVSAMLAALANRALVTPTAAARQQPPAPASARQAPPAPAQQPERPPDGSWAPEHALSPETSS